MNECLLGGVPNLLLPCPIRTQLFITQLLRRLSTVDSKNADNYGTQHTAVYDLTLIFPRGMVTTYRPSRFSLSPQNQKESNLIHLGNLKYILAVILMKKNRGYLGDGGKVRRQRWWVGGGATWEIKSNHFEKNVEFMWIMVLKLAVCIRNVIPFSYKPKTRWNSDI